MASNRSVNRKMKTSSALDENKLKSLMCHFNWDLCINITQATLKERIAILESNIKECSKEILPQIYSLLGYLKSQLVPQTTAAKEEVFELFSKALECFPRFEHSSTKQGIGSRAVMVGNLLTWKALFKQQEEAACFLNEYEEIWKTYKDINNHPEALAIKAFASGHISSFQSALVSVKAYTSSLSDEMYKDKVEWLFGLARSKTILSYKRFPTSPEDLSEIENIYRRVITIKPNYSLAMLKLARILFRLHGFHATEEVNHWIEAALNEGGEKVIVLEEAALLYYQISNLDANYIQKALDLYNEAKTINPNSKKTMQGLAKIYLNRYYEKKKKCYLIERDPPKDLNLAVEYFENSAKNKKPYDRLKLAKVYLEKSRFTGFDFLRHEAEGTFTEVIKELEDNNDPLSLAEAYTEYAYFLKKVDRQEEGIYYLRKVADMLIQDENLAEKEMRYIRQSHNELLKYASNKRLVSKADSLELKGFVQRKKQNFHSAIFYLEKAIDNPGPYWSEKFKTMLRNDLEETQEEARKLKLQIVSHTDQRFKTMASKVKEPYTKTFETPSVNDQSVVDLLVCHFNWDLCKNITQPTLKERIDALENHIKEYHIYHNYHLLSQSYSLLGYLKSRLEPQTNATEKEVFQLFLKALTYSRSFEELGSEAVIVANCWIWKLKHRQQNEVMVYYKRYEEIRKICKDIENHPEASAMKGFAFGHFTSFQKARMSVKAYTKALSDEMYKDQVEWLFGIARSKALLSHKRDPPSPEDLTEIENILRRVIQINPNYSLAMLELARTLFRSHKAFLIEEIENLIQAALTKGSDKVLVLEEAAFVYLKMTKGKLDYTKEAIDLFTKAEKLNSNSKRTSEGLGTVCWKIFRRYKSEYSRQLEPPDSLKMAMKYFEESAENKRHCDRLRLANIYCEISKFHGHDNFLNKSENTFKAVIEELSKEDDLLCIAQAYRKYAGFLKSNDRQEERIYYLREVAAMSIHDENLDEKEMRYIRRSQHELLEYASEGQLLDPDLLELKGFIQCKKRNFHSAIFYLEKAIENPGPNWSKAFKVSLKEDLVMTLLEASKLILPLYLSATPQQWFNKAKKMIEKVPETQRKCTIEFEAVKTSTYKLMGHDKQLKRLRDYRLKFEQVRMDINKQNLQIIHLPLSEEERSEQEEREKREVDRFFEVISESRCVLDRGMDLIKNEFFATPNTSARSNAPCYYPFPRRLKAGNKKCLSEQMEHYLDDRIKLNQFKNKLPDLFEFLVEKQPELGTDEYEWLQDFVDITNDFMHKHNYDKMLEQKFSSRTDREKFLDQVSTYAAEVWNRFQLEINKTKQRIE